MNMTRLKAYKKATDSILAKYVQAIANETIAHPLSWAIYEVWKMVERDGL